MKKLSNYFIVMIAVFFLTFFYLHQKIKISVSIYELNKKYSRLNSLLERKEYLLYNLRKNISLANLNRWAKRNQFSQPQERGVIALRNKVEKLKFTRTKGNISPRGIFAPALAEESASQHQ